MNMGQWSMSLVLPVELMRRGRQTWQSVLRLVSHGSCASRTMPQIQLYTKFGGPAPHRPVEDLAFAVARFIQKGGSFINYYMAFMTHRAQSVAGFSGSSSSSKELDIEDDRMIAVVFVRRVC